MPATIESLTTLYQVIAEAPSLEELIVAFPSALEPFFPGGTLMLKQHLMAATEDWWNQMCAVVTEFFGGKGLIPAMMLFENYPGELPEFEDCVPLSYRGELFGFICLPATEEETSRERLLILERVSSFLAVRLDHFRLQQKGDELMPFLLASQQKAIMTELLRQQNEDLEEASARLEDSYQELLKNKEQLVQSEKLSSLGRFTAGIAHELNTPISAVLNSVTTLTDLIREYEASAGDPEVSIADHHGIAEDMTKAVAIIQSAMEKSARLVRTLKNNTRDTGERRRFSVQAELDSTLLLLQPQIKAASGTLRLDVPAQEIFLTGDSSKLGQVLTNLLVNAFDAYEGKPGEVTLAMKVQGPELVMSVADQGCGIPSENLDRIFDPLFTTKDIGKGTGLGLMIVQGIVTGHFGGQISVESGVGAGTTFTLRLPIPRE